LHRGPQDGVVADLQKKRFSEPDERVLFPGIVEELIEIGGFTLGKTTHDPGWRYSTDMGSLVGEEWCDTRHVGIVVQGKLLFTLRDGTEMEFGPDEIYDCPSGHDSLVTSEEPLITIDVSGARAWVGFRSGFHDRVLATLLMTDLVGSTARAMAVGDAAWREALALHHERVRGELELFRGREIDTAGDGVLAMFDGAARALQCAAAIRTAVAPDGLQVRVGVHVGEVEVAGDDLRGVTVHEVARIAALAEPGEILVSEITRTMAAAAGLVFDDRGEHELKGLPGSHRLFAYVGGEPPATSS
jgi:class 3 adenylate cyclase